MNCNKGVAMIRVVMPPFYYTHNPYTHIITSAGSRRYNLQYPKGAFYEIVGYFRGLPLPYSNRIKGVGGGFYITLSVFQQVTGRTYAYPKNPYPHTVHTIHTLICVYLSQYLTNKGSCI